MIRMLVTLCLTLAVCAGCGEKGAQLPPSALSNQERAYIDQGHARADRDIICALVRAGNWCAPATSVSACVLSREHAHELCV